MPIAVYFHLTGLSVEQLAEVHRCAHDGIDGAAPQGYVHHSVFGTDGDLMIYDIWESQEDFEAFGNVLMPILGELGVEAGQPAVVPLIHKQYQRARS